ncbi:MAG: preprotein translocase subunit SecE [Acidimicrobiia bacterium]|nr:preprotein translocase subunit SecE [Acidimicrobiia bacterium]
MNREMRRLQAKEEERAKKRRAEGPRPKKKKDDDLSFFQRIAKYFREVRQELKKVAWPSREELTTYTVVVFGVTAILTLVVFGLDWTFNKGIIAVLEAIT